MMYSTSNEEMMNTDATTASIAGGSSNTAAQQASDDNTFSTISDDTDGIPVTARSTSGDIITSDSNQAGSNSARERAASSTDSDEPLIRCDPAPLEPEQQNSANDDDRAGNQTVSQSQESSSGERIDDARQQSVVPVIVPSTTEKKKKKQSTTRRVRAVSGGEGVGNTDNAISVTIGTQAMFRNRTRAGTMTEDPKQRMVSGQEVMTPQKLWKIREQHRRACASRRSEELRRRRSQTPEQQLQYILNGIDKNRQENQKIRTNQKKLERRESIKLEEKRLRKERKKKAEEDAKLTPAEREAIAESANNKARGLQVAISIALFLMCFAMYLSHQQVDNDPFSTEIATLD